MEMIRNEHGPTVKLNDFELTGTHLLPHDLVEKRKHSETNSNTCASIADTTNYVSSTSIYGEKINRKDRSAYSTA